MWSSIGTALASFCGIRRPFLGKVHGVLGSISPLPHGPNPVQDYGAVPAKCLQGPVQKIDKFWIDFGRGPELTFGAFWLTFGSQKWSKADQKDDLKNECRKMRSPSLRCSEINVFSTPNLIKSETKTVLISMLFPNRNFIAFWSLLVAFGPPSESL